MFDHFRTFCIKGLTNRKSSFQLIDVHLLGVLLHKNFKAVCLNPKMIVFRDCKQSTDLQSIELSGNNDCPNENYNYLTSCHFLSIFNENYNYLTSCHFLSIFDDHARLKKKLFKASMHYSSIKSFKKEIYKRSPLKIKNVTHPSNLNWELHRRQSNKCLKTRKKMHERVSLKLRLMEL